MLTVPLDLVSFVLGNRRVAGRELPAETTLPRML